LRVFFATDGPRLRGLLKKFLNAGQHYKADV
jgi:hypothetical protein